MRFSSLIAALGLASYASAHVKMSKPTPFKKLTMDNSPLKTDGTDFPCKQSGGVYDAEGVSNPMVLGSTQPLNFIGSAVHGGGSCQVSITYDPQPDKNSVWKVIHSIEGGCPMKGIAGNNIGNSETPSPDTYHFTIPTGLPTGNAILAWTWFNKVGNREMYMNCAPITLSAGSAKRTAAEDQLVGNLTQLVERDQAFFNSLPNMFVANLDGNSCGTTEGYDVVFPNPGDSLERLGLATSSALTAPSGSCQTQAVGSAPTTAVGVAPVVTSASVASSTTALPGGVFFTVPVQSSAPVVTSTPAPAASSAAAVVPTPMKSSVAPAAPAKSSAAPVPVVGGSTIAPGTPCPGQEGNWNCIAGNSFQRCASGQWSVVQAVAAGTQCESGVSQSIKMAPAKREVRFSNAHVRRHLVRSF